MMVVVVVERDTVSTRGGFTVRYEQRSDAAGRERSDYVAWC